jgi:RecA-family ATPase
MTDAPRSPEQYFDEHATVEYYGPNGNGQDRPERLPYTDFCDMDTVSKKIWLVHHLLAVGETSVFYGEPGSGKSVLAEDIGLHIAAGLKWHGRPVKQMAVLYVALERANVVARRALAFAREHNLERARLPFTMVRGPLDFRDPGVARLIVAAVTDLAKRYGCEAGLIIVDTVSRALCGGDENSPKDMGQLIANLGQIQGNVDIHLLLATISQSKRIGCAAMARC